MVFASCSKRVDEIRPLHVLNFEPLSDPDERIHRLASLLLNDAALDKSVIPRLLPSSNLHPSLTLWVSACL